MKLSDYCHIHPNEKLKDSRVFDPWAQHYIYCRYCEKCTPNSYQEFKKPEGVKYGEYVY